VLYLFNSAYRPLYLTNVLNTLGFPQDCVNEYRYKHSGDSRQIAPALYSTLSSIRRSEECVIIFIDRFAEDGYVYYPLRRAGFVMYRDVNEYVHFRVQLGSFIYPRDLAAFNRDLKQALGPQGLPTLTGGDPRNTRDGNYAIQGASIFGNSDQYQVGNPAWNSAVEALVHTQALSTTPQQAPVFLMVEIQDQQKQRTAVPALESNASLYKLDKNKYYELMATYRFPRQRTEQTARGQLALAFGDSLKGQATLSIDTHANSVTIPFIARRYAEEASGVLTIGPVPKPGEPEILLGNFELRYELGESTAFWLQITLALILFSLVGALIGIDFVKIQPLTAKTLMHEAWPKLVLGAFQTGVLFWLFRLIGKKIL
jgi:hypothetical protein